MTKEAQCQQVHQDLDRSQRSLADLETHGIAAMSRYDTGIAHGGRAKEGLQTTRGLVSNHIVCSNEHLSHCDEPVPQITLFDASLLPEDAPSPQ